MVTPPAGGTPTTTITDAQGRTVELREHTTAAGVAAAYQSTTYHYDGRDELTSVEDASHNSWRYTYDVKGRPHIADDPDKGRTVADYDATDDVLHTTDADGHELTYAYDPIGRKQGVYDGDAVDPVSFAIEVCPRASELCSGDGLCHSSLFVAGLPRSSSCRGRLHGPHRGVTKASALP